MLNYLLDNYNTLSGNYAILNDKYVAPVLALYAKYECFDKLYAKIENNGIFLRNTDTAESISDKIYTAKCYSIASLKPTLTFLLPFLS